MSDEFSARLRGRRVLAVFVALFTVGAIGAGGALLPSQSASSPPPRTTQVGRTTAVCAAGTSSVTGATPSAPATPDPGTPSPVVPAPSASAAPSPAATSTEAAGAPATVAAVTLGRPDDQPGRLSGAGLDGSATELSIEALGRGDRISGVRTPVVLTADGVMATRSVGAVLTSAESGTDAGLAAAPCLTPATSAWFSGLGAEESDRTELILTNPDDTQAQVDLKFYGSQGRVVVPGSPGLVVDAHASRTVSLSSIVEVTGPLGLSVEASQGRVSAVARRLQSKDLDPAGVDWAVPTAGPSTTVLIPAVPGDAGARRLVVTNPSEDRATVSVSVLGLQGAYVPTGADRLEVPAESSTVVSLDQAMAGEAGSVMLTSDRPVTAAVVSNSQVEGASTDVAVQSGASPLVGSGVSAIATSSGTDSELVVSNAGADDVSLDFEVLSYDGVSLRKDALVLVPGSTATRRLKAEGPAYVVVSVPRGASVIGGIVLTGNGEDIAGLATLPLVSPDLAARAPRSVSDPTVGR